MICKQCAGEGCRIDGKKSYPSNCSSCIAESLVRHVGNVMGILSLEGARKLCDCFANNHEGSEVVPLSKQFIETTQEHKRQFEVEQEEKKQRIFYEDEKKQEAIDYYQKRIQELKELDKGGPEWILEGETLTDDN